MKKPHNPIDNTPHDSPPTPPSARPAAIMPEVYRIRSNTTANDRQDARVYAAVASQAAAHVHGVDATMLARHSGLAVDDVLDALDRLIQRKLLKLVPGTTPKVLPT